MHKTSHLGTTVQGSSSSQQWQEQQHDFRWQLPLGLHMGLQTEIKAQMGDQSISCMKDAVANPAVLWRSQGR
jgi:hypothetical protein